MAAVAAVAPVTALMLTACAVGPPPMSHEGLLPLTEPVAAAHMLPLATMQASGKLITAGGEHDGVALSLQPATDEPGVWLWQVADASTSAIREGEQGERLLLWETSTTDGVKVVYAIPLVFLPASLEPGRTYTGSSDVLVTKLSDGSVREQGTVEYEVAALGHQTLTIAGAPVTVTVVRETRRMRLQSAQSVVVVTTGYAPDVGTVVQTVDERTTVLGLVSTQRRQRLERQEAIGR
jgi:hypothetical protein